jgi:hypothetical protein
VNVLAALAAAVLVAAASASTSGTSNLTIPCGAGVQAPADWFKPTGAATGLVWLQHGYLGSKADVAEVGRIIADKTGALVVSPTVPSSGACWIDGTAMHQAVAETVAGRAALEASAGEAGWTQTLPGRVVFVGHSSGGNLGVDAARYLDGSAVDVRGVVMLDGASQDTAMTQMRQALPLLDVPVLQVGAPPGPCVPDRRGTRALVESRPGAFVGVELARGNHLDAVGYVNFWANLICGWPRAENVAASRQIMADWVTNLLTGTSLGITGGTPGQRITVGQATAVVLG